MFDVQKFLSFEASRPEEKRLKLAVRFGYLPPNRLSFNHRELSFERGISCWDYEFKAPDIFARLPPIPSEEALAQPDFPHAQREYFIALYNALIVRPVFLVAGRVVGRGAENEPVLAAPLAVGCLKSLIPGVVQPIQANP